MFPGLLGFGVGQFAGRRKVPGHEFRTLLAQAAQVGKNLWSQVTHVDPFGNLRPDLPLVFRAYARPGGSLSRWPVIPGVAVAPVGPVIEACAPVVPLLPVAAVPAAIIVARAATSLTPIGARAAGGKPMLVGTRRARHVGQTEAVGELRTEGRWTRLAAPTGFARAAVPRVTIPVATIPDVTVAGASAALASPLGAVVSGVSGTPAPGSVVTVVALVSAPIRRVTTSATRRFRLPSRPGSISLARRSRRRARFAITMGVGLVSVLPPRIRGARPVPPVAGRRVLAAPPGVVTAAVSAPPGVVTPSVSGSAGVISAGRVASAPSALDIVAALRSPVTRPGSLIPASCGAARAPLDVATSAAIAAALAAAETALVAFAATRIALAARAPAVTAVARLPIATKITTLRPITAQSASRTIASELASRLTIPGTALPEAAPAPPIGIAIRTVARREIGPPTLPIAEAATRIFAALPVRSFSSRSAFPRAAAFFRPPILIPWPAGIWLLAPGGAPTAPATCTRAIVPGHIPVGTLGRPTEFRTLAARTAECAAARV